MYAFQFTVTAFHTIYSVRIDLLMLRKVHEHTSQRVIQLIRRFCFFFAPELLPFLGGIVEVPRSTNSDHGLCTKRAENRETRILFES